MAEKKEKMYDLYKERGKYSPVYGGEDSVGMGIEIIDPVEDNRRLDFSRAQYKVSGTATVGFFSFNNDVACYCVTDVTVTMSYIFSSLKRMLLWKQKLVKV